MSFSVLRCFFFFLFNVNCDYFFNTYLFPNNSISLIIPKLIRNLISSQLKILYTYGFLVYSYIFICTNSSFMASFFLFFFFFFNLNFLKIETLLIVLIFFFLLIIFIFYFIFKIEFCSNLI